MKSIVTAAVLVSILSTTVFAEQFVVDGQTDAWISTGINAAAGDEIAISATGCINFGNVCGDECLTDPDGENCVTGETYSHTECVPDCFRCTNERQFSLIGRIDGGQCFVIGSAATYLPFQHDADLLEISYNDRVGHYDDSSGAFQVTITVTAPPNAVEVSTWGSVKALFR